MEFHLIKRLAAALGRNALYGQWYKSDQRALHRLLDPLEDLAKLTSVPEGRTHGIRKLLVIVRPARRFRVAGLNPLEHKLVVVKLGYLFPELRAIAPREILTLSLVMPT